MLEMKFEQVLELADKLGIDYELNSEESGLFVTNEDGSEREFTVEDLLNPSVHTGIGKLEYVIPIQDEENFKKVNEELGTDFKSTEWHINDLHDKLDDLIIKCGDEGGWFVYESIKVKLTVEYEPEDK